MIFGNMFVYSETQSHVPATANILRDLMRT
jgi:hypothetical protein